MFESGYEYRTICIHRSVISALHSNVEGRPVGEHPQVSSLITEVFNNRPTQPKYNFIWDIQLVLDYLKKELPNNSDLSEKLLTFEVNVTGFDVSIHSNRSSYFRYLVYCKNLAKVCFQIAQTT